MLMLVPLFVAIVVARARGGALRALAELPVRGGAFLGAALAIQILLYLPPLRGAPIAVRYGGGVYVAALGLALVGALRNWRLGPAARIATLGLALNLVVIAANDGYMPVNATAMSTVQGATTTRDIAAARRYANVHLAGASTRLTLLSDMIPLRIPRGPGNVYSVGDMLLTAGIATLAYKTMRRPLAN
jgi:hypothetical protein